MGKEAARQTDSSSQAFEKDSSQTEQGEQTELFNPTANKVRALLNGPILAAQRRAIVQRLATRVGNRQLQQLIQRNPPGPAAPSAPAATSDPYASFWKDSKLGQMINDSSLDTKEIIKYIAAFDFDAEIAAVQDLQGAQFFYTVFNNSVTPAATRVDEVLKKLNMPGALKDKYSWKDSTLGVMVQSAATPLSAIETYLNTMNPAARHDASIDLGQARILYRAQKNPDAPDLALARVNKLLDKLFLDSAKNQAPGVTAPEGGWTNANPPPPSLLNNTSAPTTQQQEQIRDLLVPPTGQSGGVSVPFEPVVSGQDYGQRIEKRLGEWSDETYNSMVVGKGEAEHKTDVHPMARFEEIAAAAKEKVDDVFGGYARGPAFKGGKNLKDWFEVQQKAQAAMGPQQKLDQAKGILRYAMQSDGGINTINKDHHAIPEHAAENAIITPIVNKIAANSASQKRLLEVWRGWPGMQDPSAHTVNIQRFKESDPIKDRHNMWYNFQVLMHEYLHSITHEKHARYAASFPGKYDSRQYNTLIEGMTSLMTDIAWNNTKGQVTNQALRNKVEGTQYAAQNFDAATIPEISHYASISQARNIAGVVGIENVYASYFLGKTELIKAAPPTP